MRVWQVGSFSVAEVVLRLTGADEALASYISPSQTSWLEQTNLMDELVEQVQACACIVMCC